MNNRLIHFSILFLIVNCTLGYSIDAQENSPNRSKSEADAQAQAKTISLFDGKTLARWKVTNFGGEGDCQIVDGELVVEAGYPMSGVTYTGKDLPKTNYELSFDAMKTQGDDFFCLLYTSPSPRDLSTSRMPSSA